jgi:choline dehydrogenase-like flavoprotein
VAYGEMLPRHENHVTLHPERRDAWGIPILRIDCGFSDNERALQRHMVEALSELIEVAGGRVEEPADYLVPGGFVHEMGTARMGHDPKTSVLNGFAQSWDVPNVFVMDGAAWPSGAWQNPTFTIMAIAGRACEHLVHELERGRL